MWVIHTCERANYLMTGECIRINFSFRFLGSIRNIYFFETQVINVYNAVYLKGLVFKSFVQQLESYLLKACFCQKNLTRYWPRLNG